MPGTLTLSLRCGCRRAKRMRYVFQVQDVCFDTRNYSNRARIREPELSRRPGRNTLQQPDMSVRTECRAVIQMGGFVCCPQGSGTVFKQIRRRTGLRVSTAIAMKITGRLGLSTRDSTVTALRSVKHFHAFPACPTI